MKALVTAAVVGLLALVATPLSAQFVWLGGGGTFPTSDYGEYANTGYLLMAGGAIPVGGAGLNIGVNGFYGQNSHEAVDGDKTNPYGFMAMFEYDFSGADADGGLYALAEAGILWHSYSSETLPAADGSESGFGYAGALGYGFPLGGVNGWIEGRFMNASISDENTQFLGIVAGISINFGDN